MILKVDSGKTHLIILRFAWAHLRNELMNLKICRLVVLWVQVTTYPHTHKLYISTYTQRYTHTELHTITYTHTYYSIAHTHSTHTRGHVQTHAHTSHTIHCEQIELQAKLLNYFLGSNKSNINQKGGTRQELGELRVTDKSVVESRVSESLFIYMYFVLYDGDSNSWWSPKWIMGHEPSGN